MTDKNKYNTRYYDCDEGRSYRKVRLLRESEFDKSGRIIKQIIYEKSSVYDLWQEWIKEYLHKTYPKIMYSPALREETTNQYLTKKGYNNSDIPYILRKTIYSETEYEKCVKVEYKISDWIECCIDDKDLFWIVYSKNEDCYRKVPGDVLEILANRVLEQTMNDNVEIRVAEHVSEYHEFQYWKNDKIKSEKIYVSRIEQECTETIYNNSGGYETTESRTLWHKWIY